MAIGAFIGDNLCYLLGRKIGDPVADRLFGSEKGQARLHWAEQALRRRGAILIGVGRFIPGGRTATTFAAAIWAFQERQGKDILGDELPEEAIRPLRFHPADAGFEAGRVSGTGSNDPSPETLFWRPRSAFARASSPAFGVTAIHLA